MLGPLGEGRFEIVSVTKIMTVWNERPPPLPCSIFELFSSSELFQNDENLTSDIYFFTCLHYAAFSCLCGVLKQLEVLEKEPLSPAPPPPLVT